MKAVGYKKSLPIEDAQSLFDFDAPKPEPKGALHDAEIAAPLAGGPVADRRRAHGVFRMMASSAIITYTP